MTYLINESLKTTVRLKIFEGQNHETRAFE
jgi:hypothetical protein